MQPKISAFPKCYIEQIAAQRSMSIFDWIEMAKALDADGLEMYDGFFTSLEPGYLDSVRAAIEAAGFVMPMLSCSPDFTNPDAANRHRELAREANLIAAPPPPAARRAVRRRPRAPPSPNPTRR